LAVVYLARAGGGYYIFDYFGNHFEVSWAPDGTEPTEVSQFFTMGVDDYLLLDNVNLTTVVEDFKQVKPSDLHLELGTAAMLTMLKAYDKKPSAELLNAARQLCEWQQEYPNLVSTNTTVLNRLQIVLRERELSFHEKAELYPIAANATDPFHRIGAFLLLDEQDEAKAVLESLNEEELKKFKDYPIYKFYRYSEEETENGKTQDALGE
jgi:hypothetical protein